MFLPLSILLPTPSSLERLICCRWIIKKDLPIIWSRDVDLVVVFGLNVSVGNLSTIPFFQHQVLNFFISLTRSGECSIKYLAILISGLDWTRNFNFAFLEVELFLPLITPLSNFIEQWCWRHQWWRKQCQSVQKQRFFTQLKPGSHKCLLSNWKAFSILPSTQRYHHLFRSSD